MAFDDVADGIGAFAHDVQQLIDAFNGVAGQGQPLDMIALDANRYYQVIKNLHSNSKCVQFFKSDGTILFQVDKDGVKGSLTGAANAVALAASASPVLTGSIALDGRVFFKRSSTTTASATTITLPNDGSTVFPISGTQTILDITSVDRMLTVLEFQSAGCIVDSSGPLRINGDFVSTGGSSLLVLLCSSGGNWQEFSRGGDVN